MHAELLWQFQSQVQLQCQFVLFATEDLAKGLRANDTRRIFYALQSLLGAAANISKALWGQRKAKTRPLAAQRELLRASIDVTEQSPFYTVAVRNRFEHFDEALDDWWKKSPMHSSADLNFGPVMFSRDSMRWTGSETSMQRRASSLSGERNSTCRTLSERRIGFFPS